MVIVSPPSDKHPRLLLTNPIAAITVLQFKRIFLGELSPPFNFLSLFSPTLHQPWRVNRTPKGQQSSKLSPASVCSRLQVAYIKMFVPKAGGRNTRRRQRTSSDDSVNPPKAKRQRSVLRRPDESPSDTNLGRELAKATPTAPNGDTITPTDQMNDLHISTRVVKQGDGSGNNNEGSIVLVGYLNIFARSFRPSSQKC